MAGLLNTGLMNMGGLGGLLGSAPQSNMTIAQLFNPASMRNSQIKRGLLSAGMAMMNPDPNAPPRSFGQVLGQAAAGGAQGAYDAKQDFYNDGMMSLQLQELQRAEDSRQAQNAAMEELIPTLPPEMQSFARAYPQQFGEAYMKAQMPGGSNWKEVTLEDGVYAVNEADPSQKMKIGDRANRNEGEGREFTQTRGLRSDYTKQAKPYEDLRTMYQRMIASYEGAGTDQTGASDIAMVFSYMKMLDPTSVVRENEQATAQNAGGVPDQIRTMFNRLLTGERLPQSVRDAFMDQAGLQYEQQLGSYNQTRSQFSDFARKRGLDPFEVAPDLTYGVTKYQRKNSNNVLKSKYGLE